MIRRTRRILGHEADGPLVLVLLAMVVIAGSASAHDPEAQPAPAAGEGSLAEVGKKLSNPLTDIWALNTQFGLIFSDGDVNTGDSEVSGSMIFQPILSVPLFGKDENLWKLVMRPVVPILFQAPVPTGFDTFDRETALGDISIPFLLSPPSGQHWLLGLGPTVSFPTATVDALGQEQFSIGPAALIGWKNEDVILGVFPQYFFKVGSIGDQADKPDVSNMTLLYFAFYNLPKAWQVGLNPTVTYDNKASPGNQWNVPIGLTVAKTTRIGNLPVKFQFGIDYSVVSQDDFGQRVLIKLNVIPVIKPLVKKSIFGGG